MEIAYQLIENQADFDRFYEQNQTIDWFCFDTEFISEKLYTPQLCLVQVGTANGIFILDTLQIPDYQAIADFLTNPNILKITHAGENDYRIFRTILGVTPQNVFDTQIAVGFLTGLYPLSFKDLVEQQLEIKLDKGSKISNWSQRPINRRQLEYAVKDVLYLKDLYDKLKVALEAKNRFDWVLEECKRLENEDFYESDPLKDLNKSRTFQSLSYKEKVFFMRLVQWRHAVAEEKNHSKNRVLDSKIMYEIIRTMSSGKKALQDHRIIPNWVLSKYWALFTDFYESPPTEEETALIRAYSKPQRYSPQRAFTMEFLSLLIKHKAMENEVANSLIISRADLDKMEEEAAYFPPELETGWRRALLGEELIAWLQKRNRVNIELSENVCVVRRGA